MDLKLKGKTWAGNIYQKFEAMCQEVDDLVSQDTIKYVENQVQTVGENVKKIYSDVVQDLLPSPLVDSVKHDVETVPQKLNKAIWTYAKSITNIEEKHLDMNTKQSLIEQGPTDPLDNYHTLPSFGLSPVNQLVCPPTADLTKLADSVLSSGKDDGSLIYENINNTGFERKVGSEVEEAITEEQSPSEDINSLENNVNTSLECIVGSDVEETITKEQSLSEDLSSLVNKIGVSLPSESIDGYYINGSLTEVSSANLDGGLGIGSFAKEREISECYFDESYCPNISSTSRSSELRCSVGSSGSKVAETTFISSNSSHSTESYCWSEFSHAIPQETEKTCYDHTDAFYCVSDSSDLDSSRIDEAFSMDGSSGDKRELCCKCSQLEDLMSSLDIDTSMETVDLSDKVKLDESCVIVDNKLLFAVPCRARRFSSYKKIIQDAFASRKRLAKEYEQLAIWYGDIDMESAQHPKQNAFTNALLETRRSPNKDLCNNEWELL